MQGGRTVRHAAVTCDGANVKGLREVLVVLGSYPRPDYLRAGYDQARYRQIVKDHPGSQRVLGTSTVKIHITGAGERPPHLTRFPV